MPAVSRGSACAGLVSLLNNGRVTQVPLSDPGRFCVRRVVFSVCEAGIPGTYFL
jgi:hypothetical protein